MIRHLRAATLPFATLPLAALAALLLAPFLFSQAVAHHGWSWTTGGNIELTGIIRESKLGNPHGELKVEAEGEVWTVEVGQPWRNERAGLSDSDFAVGNEITIVGEPSADMAQKLLKAEMIIISGKEYPLYPNRS
ncbi:DUF6152 family protein [Thalassobaculum litoreum]|uniref:Uncharacterized protein n=1 Tax=Thalassobaculum litoreum DSM 18839 TaxID=1123362 RepID=A0A8G2EWS0_9PROT|nr:DUF6152 family protein [Thalassobaculum litoreum]SDF93600.1 hypothetical protein SAMN05660686_02797 [Thalassobaculum litoreum DSM 18839]